MSDQDATRAASIAPACSERWNAARVRFMAEIDAIDKDTQRQETEPTWWLHMMEARRVASGLHVPNVRRR
jgi:hypothetical protein